MVTKLKPVRAVKASTYKSRLARSVMAYEQRYEMPTSEMRRLVMLGGRAETDEIAKWLHEANVLALLANGTDGSVSTRTARSTKPR